MQYLDTAETERKVAYVLFYVTEIAALRKDMVPKDYSSQDK